MTDLVGQTGLGGSAVPGDRAVRDIVGNKDPILQSVGRLTEGSRLYYTLDNSSVDMPEIRQRQGNAKISSNSKTFGGRSTFVLNNVSFQQNIFLRLRLPAGKTGFDNIAVNEGWGFGCIRKISYTLGNSSVSNLDKTGISNFMYVAGQAKNSEIAKQYLQQAGDYYVADSTATTSQYISNREAFVFIRLPWCGTSQKIPIDTQLLNNTITLSIEFYNLSEFAVGSGVGVATINEFETCEVYLRQFDLSAPSQGLKNEVRFNVDNFVTYPYQAFSEYTTSLKAPMMDAGQAAAGGGGTLAEVNIQNIINADLTEMIVMFVRDTDNPYHIDVGMMASVTYATNRQNLLLGAPMRDLELRLNGQTIIYYPGSSYYGFNQPLFMGSERLFSKSFNSPAAGTLGVTKEIESHIYKMVLAQENPLQHEGKEMYNVPRYPNMTLQLRFQPDPDRSYAGGPAGDYTHALNENRTYHIYVLQLYNAVWKLGEDMGSSELLTR